MAPVLCPNFSLCDQKFELTIDNTLFVGHPTTLPPKPSSSSSSSSEKNLSSSEEDSNKEEELGMFHLCFVLSNDFSSSGKVRSTISQFHRVNLFFLSLT